MSSFSPTKSVPHRVHALTHPHTATRIDQSRPRHHLGAAAASRYVAGAGRAAAAAVASDHGRAGWPSCRNHSVELAPGKIGDHTLAAIQPRSPSLQATLFVASIITATAWRQPEVATVHMALAGYATRFSSPVSFDRCHSGSAISCCCSRCFCCVSRQVHAASTVATAPLNSGGKTRILVRKHQFSRLGRIGHCSPGSFIFALLRNALLLVLLVL